jgi:hypothetical protein
MRITMSIIVPLAVTLLAARTLAALSPAINLPTSWSYLGCYTDSVANRTLRNASYTDNASQTGQNCISFCGAKGYPYAGTGESIPFIPSVLPRILIDITQSGRANAGAADHSLEAHPSTQATATIPALAMLARHAVDLSVSLYTSLPLLQMSTLVSTGTPPWVATLILWVRGRLERLFRAPAGVRTTLWRGVLLRAAHWDTRIVEWSILEVRYLDFNLPPVINKSDPGLLSG